MEFDIKIGLMLFCISYVYILFKAAQQISVVNDHRKWVVPVSMILAFCEVTTITVLAMHKQLWYFPFIGLGAGCGALTTMTLYANRKKNKEKQVCEQQQ